MKKKSAFTLIEVLIVLILLGILVAIVLPMLQNTNRAQGTVNAGNAKTDAATTALANWDQGNTDLDDATVDKTSYEMEETVDDNMPTD
jgi:prepilin-type N-terminal cleavage/methylation domain-containing protein